MRPTLHLLSVTAALLLGCSSRPQPPHPTPRGPRPVPAETIQGAPERLIALGDVHGDFTAMMNALLLAEVVDDDGTWIGGETVVVQTGDQLDRGDQERQILDAIQRLADEAWAAGGALHALNGNHEAMNVELDLRYVTEGGFADFADLAPNDPDAELLAFPEQERGRAAAFRPGGPYALTLSGQNTAMIVGDSAFVHGGILPVHAEVGLDRINGRVRRWMAGDDEWPDVLDGDGLVWTRNYSDAPDADDCAQLEETLALLGVARMVVGHTVQDEILAACGEQVWLVDVGMAAYYGGTPAVLEIRGDDVRVID